MPPVVALVLTLAFIAVLLVRDVRRRTSVGMVLWIPTLLLLVLGSRPLSLWFGASPTDYPEGNPIDRLFYFSLIIASAAVAISRGVRWNRFFAANLAMMAFYAFCLTSVLWSDDAMGSFKRLIKELGNLGVVAIILSERVPLEAIRAIYIRCATILIPISVVFVRYYPDWGRSYSRGGEQMFTGITTQKNSLGEIVMTFSLFVLWDYLERRPAGAKRLWTGISWDHVVLLLMGAWLLHMSNSMTALVCLLVGAVLMLRGPRLASPAMNRLLLFGTLSVPFMVFFTQQFSATIAPIAEALGRDPTFTGRTEIWGSVLSATQDRVFFGAGFFSFWGGPGGEAVRRLMETPGLHSAHNGYLDTFVDGGVIGLGLLFCVLVAHGTRLARNRLSSHFDRLSFAVLIVAILYNNSEATFARLTPIWFTTLLVSLNFRTARPVALGSVTPTDTVTSAEHAAPQPVSISRRPATEWMRRPLKPIALKGRTS